MSENGSSLTPPPLQRDVTYVGLTNVVHMQCVSYVQEHTSMARESKKRTFRQAISKTQELDF